MALMVVQAAWAAGGAEQIRTVAICAGSGSFLPSSSCDHSSHSLLPGSGVLKDVQADLYLTGELGHVRPLLPLLAPS